MRALTWPGRQKMPAGTDPRILEPTDAIARMTSTAICGSDPHLYDVLGMYLEPGDILGHEPLPLEQALHGYEIFQKKQDECIKAVLKP